MVVLKAVVMVEMWAYSQVVLMVASLVDEKVGP